MKIFKTILNIVLSFILMIGILLSIIMLIVSKQSNKEKFLKKLDEIKFYDSVYEEVQDGFKNYIYQSGLYPNIIDKICTKDKVKNDIVSILEEMYGEEKAEIDYSEIRNKLENEINDYVANENRKISSQEKENIEKFEDLIVDSYRENIEIYQNGVENISEKFPQILRLVNKLKIISIIVTIFIIVALIVINFKNIFVAGSYLGVSICSSGLVLCFIKNTIYSKLEINNLLIITKSLSVVIIDVFNSILNSIGKLGISNIIIGFIVIVGMNWFSQLKHKKY